jgi:hypothetical protein
MSRYAEALGRMKFTVAGMEFNLKPRKGDNLKLLTIQQQAGKDTTKLIRDFVPYMVELINREDNISKDDPAYKDLEEFVEFNVMDFLRETMIAFRWTTREKWEEVEKKQSEGFQASLN